MECLRNYIGILGCGSSTPESGLNINSLPGISLESIDKIADSEQKTYLKVWEDVQTRALRRLALAIADAFKKRYQIRSINVSFDLGKKIDLVTAETPAANELRGFSVDPDYPAHEWLHGSSLRMFYCQELFLYVKVVPGSAAVTVSLFDLDTKDVLFTKDIAVASLVVGWNRIAVNGLYSAERIAAVYNASQLASAQLQINPLLTEKFSTYINDWVGSSCSSCDSCNSVIRGYKSANDLSSIEYGASAYGLSGVFSYLCRYDAIVCANKMSFATSLWYLLGSELQVERAYNKSRINKWTQDPKEAFELKDYFDSEFERNLQSTVDGIDLDEKDICLKCNDVLQTKSFLP